MSPCLCGQSLTNFLAHLFLAEPTDEFRIGTILADFTAGRIEDLRQRYGPEIARGIQQHRAIDRFTDTHPLVRHSITCLEPHHGAFSGIIVDVCYDHFLLNHWETFSTVSVVEFIDAVHHSLRRDDWEFPRSYKYVVLRLFGEQGLLSYRTLDGVQAALIRLSYRFSRETTLGHAIDTVKQCYGVLNDDFLSFFPELITFVRNRE